MNKKCENCKTRDISHFHETVRNKNGGGKIMSLCEVCYIKLIVKK